MEEPAGQCLSSRTSSIIVLKLLVVRIACSYGGSSVDITQAVLQGYMSDCFYYYRVGARSRQR